MRSKLSIHAPQNHWFFARVTASSAVQFLEASTCTTVNSSVLIVPPLTASLVAPLCKICYTIAGGNSHKAWPPS